MGIGKATRRPAAPRPRPATDKAPALGLAAGPLSDAGAVVRQRDLDGADPLRQALAVLQLPHLPQGMKELVALVTEQHPHPERTWGWAHVEAYRAVFPLVVVIGRAKAAEARAARKQSHG